MVYPINSNSCSTVLLDNESAFSSESLQNTEVYHSEAQQSNCFFDLIQRISIFVQEIFASCCKLFCGSNESISSENTSGTSPIIEVLENAQCLEFVNNATLPLSQEDTDELFRLLYSENDAVNRFKQFQNSIVNPFLARSFEDDVIYPHQLMAQQANSRQIHQMSRRLFAENPQLQSEDSNWEHYVEEKERLLDEQHRPRDPDGNVQPRDCMLLRWVTLAPWDNFTTS